MNPVYAITKHLASFLSGTRFICLPSKKFSPLTNTYTTLYSKTMTIKPKTYILRIDIEQWIFDKHREEFESAINLELDFVRKEMKEKLMADYEAFKAGKIDT